MPIQFNQVTWYSKLCAVILFLLVVPILTFYMGMRYEETISMVSSVDSLSSNKSEIQVTTPNPASLDILNNTYIIDEKVMRFKDGVSYDEEAPNSSMKTVTRIFGEPIFGDLNNDGKQDAIFFVSQETSGTGLFFYVVALINQGGNYVGTPGVFIGDRIAPQNIRIENNIAAVNFAMRREGEPMVAEPSVGTTKYFRVLGNKLIEKTI